MVIGYNPSHSNVNSEVNAPFKILSIMLRYLDNEYNPKKGKKHPAPVQNYEENDEEEKQGITPGYKLRRDLLGEGERLDTYEGDEDNGNGFDYGDESGNREVEKIEATLDDVDDEDDNESLLGKSNNKEGGGSLSSQPGLFSIVQSNDKGLADMETGSEVYMSELLVR